MVHLDAFRRMWSTTFRGAIECGNMFITEITLNKTKRYNVNLLASSFSIFYFFQHSLFEYTCVFANFKRHDLQFKLYFCINMYTVGVRCVCCCYGGYLPGILCEVSIILKDMYTISPFDRFVLLFNCNLQNISKTRLQMA